MLFRRRRDPKAQESKKYNDLRKAVGMAPAESDNLGEGIAFVVVSDVLAAEVRQECNSLPGPECDVFMMTFAAYLTWMTSRAVEATIPDAFFPSVMPLLIREFSKQPWFDLDRFSSISQALSDHPPMGSTGTYTGASLGPWPEVVLAANSAGYTLTLSDNLGFYIYVALVATQLLKTLKRMCSTPPS